MEICRNFSTLLNYYFQDEYQPPHLKTLVTQRPVSIWSDKTSYSKISQSLEAAKFI